MYLSLPLNKLNQGHAPEQKPLVVAGDHFTQDKEQIQQTNLNRSKDVIFNHTMHQNPVDDSVHMHSQESHQLRGVDRMDLPNSPLNKR